MLPPRVRIKRKFPLVLAAEQGMNRQGRVRAIVTALSLLLWIGGSPRGVNAADADRLFPVDLPSAHWAQFRATAYSRPVTGIIYRGEPRPVSGLPLGGIASGYLDLETAGTFGYSTIFNYLTPRGGPLNTPFLGVAVGGKTWALTTGETKQFDPGQGPPPRPAHT